jgi:hypothetical protein
MLFHMVNDWITAYCNQEEGFPKELYAVTIWLGISGCPKQVDQEYAEEGTKYCEVMMHIRATNKFLEMKSCCVTAIGPHLTNTYHFVAYKALKYPSQMYEWHLGPTFTMLHLWTTTDQPGKLEFEPWRA